MEAPFRNCEPPFVHTVFEGAEVLGFVAVDSTVSDHSCGGLRMLPDISQAEIRALAHTMTLKYGFLGHPQGGAKAGVRGDPEGPASERCRRLSNFGRAIAGMLRSRLYVPGVDMGTDSRDIQCLLEAAGIGAGPRELAGARFGYYTALTVFSGVSQAASHLGLAPSHCTVAIEGFGSVGSALGEMLVGAGARVVAISTTRGALLNPKGLDMERLLKLRQEAGSRVIDLYPEAERISTAALLELPVDVLCPCARYHTLHAGNAARVKARIICPGANNPIAPEAEPVLLGRGILCLPDFVTNCGGVLGGAMEFASVPSHRIETFVARQIGARIAWLLKEASSQQLSPLDIAAPFALRRFAQMRRTVERTSLRNRLFAAGLELYRRGLLPHRLVAFLSLPYFRSSLR